MERYPAFRANSHNVSKHVALMGELARLIEATPRSPPVVVPLVPISGLHFPMTFFCSGLSSVGSVDARARTCVQ